MTAKYPTVGFPTEFEDATEIIATRISHATEVIATRISHASEIISGRQLSNLRLRAMREESRTAEAPIMAMREETAKGWVARIAPSLIITLWFGLVFAILAVTAPSVPAGKVVHKAASSAPSISAQVPGAMMMEEAPAPETTEAATK